MGGSRGFLRWGRLVLVVALSAIAFGAVVVDTTEGQRRFGSFGRWAVLFAKAPWTIEDLAAADTRMFSDQPRRFDGPGGWRFGPAGKPEAIPGYILLSRFDGDRRRHLIDLVDLRDFSVVHRWEPDADRLLADARRDGFFDVTVWTKPFSRTIHPLLMENGDLVIKDHYQPLIRITACGDKVWMKDDVRYHHSTEPDGDGGFWIPTLADPSTVPDFNRWFYEETLTHLNADGAVLYQRSLVRLLEKADLGSLILSGDLHRDDTLHLNDIQPVLQDGPYWKRGDVFVSIRRYSIILLFRPSTDEIVWSKMGPWISQHDVDIVDDHTIAVFNNNTIDRGKGPVVDTVSEVLFYDFATDTVTSPFRPAMEANGVQTKYEGLFHLLPSGHLMLEEEGAGRLLLFAPSGQLLASFVNNGSDGNGRRMGWSRYITQELGDAAAQALRTVDCGTDPG